MHDAITDHIYRGGLNFLIFIYLLLLEIYIYIVLREELKAWVTANNIDAVFFHI
jgi:hypothetical protein